MAKRSHSLLPKGRGLFFALNASLAAIPRAPSGAGQGKLFNQRKAANSRFGSKRFGRISSFQGGVLQFIALGRPRPRRGGIAAIDAFK